MIKVCAWHIQYFGNSNIYASMVEPNNWRQMTKNIAMMITTNQVQLSHGLCPSCAEKIQEEIDFEERRLSFVSKEEI